MTTIIIHKYQFTVSDLYSPGPHELTDNEAQTLNSVRADNIRNNAYKWVEEAERNTTTSLLDSESLRSIQSRISELDARYELAPRKPFRSSPLQDMLRIVAMERIRTQYPSAFPLLQLPDDLIQQFILDPTVQSEARRRLAIRDQLIRESLS